MKAVKLDPLSLSYQNTSGKRVVGRHAFAVLDVASNKCYRRWPRKHATLGITPIFFAVLALLSCYACAPVDHSANKEEETPKEVLSVPAEKIDIAPKPLPSGPRYRIEAAVQNVRERDLLTTNGFWTVFHGILGLGPNVKLVDPVTHKKFNAVEYICNGGELEGLEFIPTKWGLDVRTTGPTGRGQGHQDYFIAEMSTWRIPPTQKFRVYGKDYTFADFINHTKMRASVSRNPELKWSNQELSWATIVIGQYLGTDLKWTNGYGEKLRFEDLVRYELDAKMAEAACGGTHRLYGLNYVYHLHLEKGGQTVGVWKEIVDMTAKYRDLAKKYQNADGSFSTDFFNGPGNADDKERRINTTGHILEFLALALSDADIKEQWVQDAANALALMILELHAQPIQGGSLYHAVHALLMYYARVYDRETLGPPELHIPLAPGGTVSDKGS